MSADLLQHERKRQMLGLLDELERDVLLLYGNGWRKDFFKCLIDLEYFGPDAVAGVRRSGEIFALVTDPWDAERVKAISVLSLRSTSKPHYARRAVARK